MENAETTTDYFPRLFCYFVQQFFYLNSVSHNTQEYSFNTVAESMMVGKKG